MDGHEMESEEPEARLIRRVTEAGETQYERYLARPGSPRADVLSILRGWSSAVTLLEGSERLWRVGGYFLKWQGFGVVIDPGLDFLRNFHDAGFHAREINAVLVSHNHPDHNADLKSVDDIRYELAGRITAKEGAELNPYLILWDEDTAGATSFATENPAHRYEPIVLPAGGSGPIDLTLHAAMIPIRVTPFSVKHTPDVPGAMGMVIELLDSAGNVALRLGYTGDTAYFPELPTHLDACDLLLAHISQPSLEELQDPSMLKEMHLGYRGTARLIRECQPRLALIGEFWAGYNDVRIDLTTGLRLRSGCKQILPTGLGMHIKLPSLEIECTECRFSTSPAGVTVAPPIESFGNLGYLCGCCIVS